MLLYALTGGYCSRGACRKRSQRSVWTAFSHLFGGFQQGRWQLHLAIMVHQLHRKQVEKILQHSLSILLIFLSCLCVSNTLLSLFTPSFHCHHQQTVSFHQESSFLRCWSVETHRRRNALPQILPRWGISLLHTISIYSWQPTLSIKLIWSVYNLFLFVLLLFSGLLCGWNGSFVCFGSLWVETVGRVVHGRFVKQK